jgi:endonuclease/exonuclease/phosphatase family metal-dependent hydrolase
VAFLATLTAVALPLAGDAASTGLGLQPDVAAPAAIMTADGGIEVFVRGANSELVQRTAGRKGWSGWKNLGGTISSAPAVTSSRPGRLDAFVRGAGDDLVYRVFRNGRWGGWINLGGTLTSAPAAVSPAPGRIEVFVRGASGELVQRSYRNGAWGGWKNFGTRIASAPAVVSPAAGRIELFARSPEFRLLQKSYDGSRWSAWRDLGGDLTAGPAAAATGPNGVHVFVRGASGELVHRIWNGTSWSGWKNLGGAFTSAPAAATDGGRIEVFVRGGADDLVQRTYVGGLWSSWKTLGGSLRGKLRARLRVLTHNVYGLDGNLCAARAREFGWRVAHAQPAYDIVGVQEYYNVSDLDFKTCDSGPLSESIRSTGRYRNADNYYRFYPDLDLRADGGVGIFALHSITALRDWRWDNDSQSWPKAPEGFIFARIKVPGGITLDTYVVHLNSNGSDSRAEAYERRRLQLRQLRRTIADISPESGNPVLVMGDFNIGGPPSNNGNPGHPEIRSALEYSKDIWMEAWPRNDGWTYDCAANSVASDCEGRERIDYILVRNEPALTSSPYVVTIAKRADVSVVRWRTDPERLTDIERAIAGGNPPHVSDHWGVEAVIEIRDR